MEVIKLQDFSVLIFFIVGGIILYLTLKYNRDIHKGHTQRCTEIYEPQTNEIMVEEKIKSTDELFNKEQFNQKAKMLFVKIQNAFMDRELEKIRAFETDELFEKHQTQIDELIRCKQINIMDRICVLNSKLYRFEQKDDIEILEVLLKSRMAEYIINEETKKVIKGNKSVEKVKLYKLEFIRKKGLKTKPESKGLETTNCPNCGAPTKVTLRGECNYCGNIITNGNFGWVLNNLESFNQ